MAQVDVRPASCDWRTYEGTPANLRVRITHEGQAADVSDWTWQAWVATSPPTVLDCLPEDDGVTVYLRGSDSVGLPGQWWRFDVYGRHPGAGEGYAVLQGRLAVQARVTVPA